MTDSAENIDSKAEVMEILKKVINFKNSQQDLEIRRKKRKKYKDDNAELYSTSTDTLIQSYEEQAASITEHMKRLDQKLKTCNNRYNKYDKTFDKFFKELVEIVYNIVKNFTITMDLKEVFPDVDPRKLFTEFVDSRALCCRLVTMLSMKKTDLNLIRDEVQKWAKKYDGEMDSRYMQNSDLDVDFGKQFETTSGE